MSRVEATPRKAMTPKRRLGVFNAADGRCQSCQTKLQPGWAVDHIVPVWMGGADEASNWQALCVPCHALKTSGDQSAIAKVKRIHARQDGTRRERSAIPSRGFDKRFRKRMDGTVVAYAEGGVK